MKEVKIDLRPHYTFAYYTRGAMFGNESLLYYSKKDGSLHCLSGSSLIESFMEEGNDNEYVMPISETEAKNLEKVFGLMVDAIKLCQEHEDFWCVLDGEECLVICGRKRSRFDGPGPNEQLEPFNKMADRLLQINGDKNKLQKIMKTVPKVSETLEKYISSLSPSPTKEGISSCNIDKDIPEAL